MIVLIEEKDNMDTEVLENCMSVFKLTRNELHQL